MSNGKRVVTLAVIKQADENMDDMKQAITGTMNYFRKVYPDIEFSISRNQTELWTIQFLTCNRIFHWVFSLSVLLRFFSWVMSSHRLLSGLV